LCPLGLVTQSQQGDAKLVAEFDDLVPVPRFGAGRLRGDHVFDEGFDAADVGLNLPALRLIGRGRLGLP
jgi:hypothetical protein